MIKKVNLRLRNITYMHLLSMIGNLLSVHALTLLSIFYIPYEGHPYLYVKISLARPQYYGIDIAPIPRL